MWGLGSVSPQAIHLEAPVAMMFVAFMPSCFVTQIPFRYCGFQFKRVFFAVCLFSKYKTGLERLQTIEEQVVSNSVT